MNNKTRMHFTHNYVLHPTNPLIVNVIGAGGTGSHMMQALARLNHSLIALGHPGLMIYLYDDDKVTVANLGRQLFSQCDIGQYKAAVLVNRINRSIGASFKAMPFRYCMKKKKRLAYDGAAHITISCVDTVDARFDIAAILQQLGSEESASKPLYWLDLGNSKSSGQVLLSTIGKIQQPNSRKFETVAELPFITDQYKNLLQQPAEADNTPSCSLAEALNKQDLFINSSLANMASSLLWGLFREGLTAYKGFFMNLKDFRTVPIPV